jgi:hypothetical protein
MEVEEEEAAGVVLGRMSPFCLSCAIAASTTPTTLDLEGSDLFCRSLPVTLLTAKENPRLALPLFGEATEGGEATMTGTAA